jgi:tRNA A-37 threonylcarbamoyl transferase component Bud32
MTRDRYARIATIFQRVIESPVDQRGTILRNMCGGDDALEAEVSALLVKSADDLSALDQPALGRDFVLGDAEELAEAPDLTAIAIEGFRITRLIGRGAMGAVYEAEQERPRRTVAVKVLHRSFHSREVRRRFEYEAEILSRLNHPNIAGVYGAGVTADGRMPYFIMELVRGAQSITQFARAKQRATAQRIDLFLKACDAVAHGHKQGVIHRDIKPDNILVDESGEPRIIDFGIAKVVGRDAVAMTIDADAARLMGTLQYMSPEQCDGRSGAPDARSDVYSLGMVLSEVLAGKPPYDVHGLSVPDAIRVICNPVRPRCESIAGARHDLSLIIARSIELDRARRYETAGDLADDLRRYLAHEPIRARPPGTLYVLRKFVRRHRAASAAVVAGGLALLAGAVASTIFAFEAIKQRNAASASLEEQRAVAALMLDIMQSSLGSYETVSKDDLLLGAEAYLRGKLDLDAGVEGTLREYVGSGWLLRGNLRGAREQLPEALRLRRASGLPGESLVNCLYFNARMHMVGGEPDEVRRLLREALAVRRELFGPDHMRSADRDFTNSVWVYLPQEPEGRAALAALQAGREATPHADAPPATIEHARDLPLVFADEFDGEHLSEDWSVTSSNVRDQNLTLAHSRAEATAMAIAAPGQGEIRLTREVEPLADFHLSAQLSWRQLSVRDMGNVRIEFIGHDDVVMLRTGFSDGWIDWYGSVMATFYPMRVPIGPHATTGIHSLPLEGSVSIDVIRRGSQVALYRDGREFLPGTLLENLARISISFVGHDRVDEHGREARFAPISIDAIRLSGRAAGR